MFDDILGESEKPLPEVSKDSIISAQKDNIEQKEELIRDLLDRVTDLESQLEYLEQL